MWRENANGLSRRLRGRAAALLSAPAAVAVLVVAAALAAAPAGAASCSYPSAYPGDNAAKATLAAWMAGHAIEAGLPGELPVMGALVDSGLTNLKNQDSDSVGYFQMRTPIWDGGEYAGYGDRPSLQIQWFIDQALSARQRKLAAGDAAYGADPSRWGEWVADVQRPAEQYRGRYQLRLDDARALIASGCQAPADGGGGAGGQTGDAPAPGQPGDPGPGPTSEPDAQLIPESVLPDLRISAGKRQDVLRAGVLVVSAVCANEGCFARARGTIAVPGRGLYRLEAPPLKLKRGERGRFRLIASKQLLRALRAGRGSGPLGAVRVVAANSGGYRISSSRTVTIGGRHAGR